jgi:TolB-like protein/Tfp pilus assembly protein PilF
LQFRFADFVLDPDRRELKRQSETIAIGPQVFDLLACLIANRERVVSKDDLLQQVWRGRIVSESTLTSHINAARKAVGDDGQKQQLIRTVARKGFRFVAAVTEVESSDGPRDGENAAADPHDVPVSAPSLPDKPSIAVLPFQNMSGDREQDYFADGVVEDIITELSRARWLFVIARNSSFTFKDRTVDIRQVGRELGVGYVVEGSVRKAANRVLITAQLIDAATGAHLWAERFEGGLDDIFELQERIAADVAGAVSPQLERAEIERAKRTPPTNLSAYDCYLRGMANLHQGSREAIGEALTLFEKATEIDPNFASAYAMAAWCHVWRKVNGWMIDRAAETAEGTRLARRAVELGRDDAVALTRSGHALLHLAGDIDGGIALLERALVLNPNLASAWFLGGFALVWDGDSDGAIARFSQAMRLSPLDPEMYRMKAGMAAAHMLAGRYDVASSWAEQAFSNLPSFLMVVCVIAASHALAGRMDQAHSAARRLRELNPELRVSNLGDYLVSRPGQLETFKEGLRKAGLPE